MIWTILSNPVLTRIDFVHICYFHFMMFFSIIYSSLSGVHLQTEEK